ncbi:MAG TPA: hypothetical protein VF573_17350 [Paraburkholderia sp.]|uniref:hypothetical protein n=1 Tax=Paraburkholderia sp. TaxID=1926495 RepID=UPI002ED69F00
MSVDAYENCFDRHLHPLSDPRKDLFDHVANLSLPQCLRFALLRFIAFAQLKFGDRAIFAIAFNFPVASETAAQNCQRRHDDGTVLDEAACILSKREFIEALRRLVAGSRTM